MKGKGCLITIVVIIVLAAIAAYVLYANRAKLFEKAMDKMEEQILTNLPLDYDQAEVRNTFDDFVVGVKDGTVDKEETKEIAGILQAVMADKKLETHEVDQLMEAMREAIR